MKKLILPAALLALGFAFLNVPTRADWFPNMAEQLGQANDYKVNATGSTSTGPFQAQGSFTVPGPPEGYNYGGYPGGGYQGSQQDAQFTEFNQWKQTYKWQGEPSETPYTFDVTASGTASGSCSIAATGFNNNAAVRSDISFSLNGNSASVVVGGSASAGNGTNTGRYNPPSGGTKFVLLPAVDGNGNATNYLLIGVHADGSGSTYFGGCRGDCTASGQFSGPIPHGL